MQDTTWIPTSSSIRRTSSPTYAVRGEPLGVRWSPSIEQSQGSCVNLIDLQGSADPMRLFELRLAASQEEAVIEGKDRPFRSG